MTFHKAEDTIFLQQVSLKTLKLPKWARVTRIQAGFSSSPLLLLLLLSPDFSTCKPETHVTTAETGYNDFQRT